MKDVKTIEIDKGKDGKCLLKIDPAIITSVSTSVHSYTRTERKNWFSPKVETPIYNGRLYISTTQKVESKDASWYTSFDFLFESEELLDKAYAQIKSLMNMYDPKEDPKVTRIVQIMKDTDPDKITRIVEIMKATDKI